MQFNNAKLKQGYIFIPVASKFGYSEYLIAMHRGLIGYFAKIDENAPNGYQPVTFEEYEIA
jgi:hypothetical protein